MNEQKTGGFIEKLATFIVDKRNLFFLLYIFAFIFCLFSMNWVQVENDVTTYLSDDTETRQGLVAMNENFVTFGTAQVMVSNITYETAEEIYNIIVNIDGVDMVTFDSSLDHYAHASALYDVSFAGGNFDDISLQAMAEIEEKLSEYDLSVYTMVGYDENAMLQQEMTTILVVAAIISPEKAVWSLGCVSQKNCLNEVKTLGSASTEPVVFCCGKTAAATLFVGLLQLFCCDRLRVDSPFCADCPDGHGPQTN